MRISEFADKKAADNEVHLYWNLHFVVDKFCVSVLRKKWDVYFKTNFDHFWITRDFSKHLSDWQKWFENKTNLSNWVNIMQFLKIFLSDFVFFCKRNIITNTLQVVINKHTFDGCIRETKPKWNYSTSLP